MAKERIKILKRPVASSLASKGVLREIHALAQELGQAAKELSEDFPPAHTTEGADISESADQHRKLLTWDRGVELKRHAGQTKDTGLPVYFCNPKCA